jgi:hypothetical protein
MDRRHPGEPPAAGRLGGGAKALQPYLGGRDVLEPVTAELSVPTAALCEPVAHSPWSGPVWRRIVACPRLPGRLGGRCEQCFSLPKLVATELDGTLVRSDETVSDYSPDDHQEDP